jgi:pimeloyl-ACP methyl ester carboxylesterase
MAEGKADPSPPPNFRAPAPRGLARGLDLTMLRDEKPRIETAMRLSHVDIPAAAADAGASPLVVAHGLFGAARNWGGLSKRFAQSRRVIAVDMRNHGDSPHDAAHDYPAMAGDLAETIDAAGAPAAVLGHSMGGKAAMALALTEPDLVERLIVADIAPVAYNHTQQDYIDAMRAADLSAVAKRSDAEPMLMAAAPEPGVRAFLLQNLVFEDGRARWRLNLDALEANMDALIGFPRLSGRYDGPALFVHGGASDYVTDAHRSEILRLFPAARIVAIPGAGHWLHAEKPKEFLDATLRFLSS